MKEKVASILPDDPKIRIIKNALEEFTSRGYHGARMDSIARSAGVNKAMLYYYFVSKEELYRKALEFTFTQRENDSMINDTMDALATSTEKFCFIIHILVKMHFLYYDKNMKKLMHWQAVEENTEILSDLVKRYVHPNYAKIHKIVTDGIASGEFKPMNPSMPIYLTINAVAHYHEMETFYVGSALYRDLYGKDKINMMIDNLSTFILATMLQKPEMMSHCKDGKIAGLADGIIHKLMLENK